MTKDEIGSASDPGKNRGLGRFYGLGVGPGDPELLTLKAHRILTHAPVICAPKRGYSADGYAYKIIKEFIDPDRQELLELIFPMSKDISRLIPYWEDNLRQIMERINSGKDCAFITEGDPLLYSTFINVLNMLQERHPEVPVQVVPGVSSISAAAASALVPLANGDDRVAIIPATYEPERLKEVLTEFDTIALMKVNSVFDTVLDVLEELRLIDKAVFVKKATAPGEEEIVRDVRTLRGTKIEYMSILLVAKGKGE